MPTRFVRSACDHRRSSDGCPKIYYLELLRASVGTLSSWSRVHFQSLSATNLHWARVVGYGSPYV
jgi:hypothetical protein